MVKQVKTMGDCLADKDENSCLAKLFSDKLLNPKLKHWHVLKMNR